MKKYLVLDENSIVENIIVAASLEVAESVTASTCVFIPTGSIAAVGDLYDGSFPTTPAE
jgi:hypothetical protein